MLGSALQDTGDLPPFLQAQVLFPYLGGEQFISNLRDRADGQWDLVDTAFRLRAAGIDRADPAPGRLLRRRRSQARAAAASAKALGGGWKRATAGTWGELQTREMLALGGGNSREGGGRLGRRPLRAVAVGRQEPARDALALGHASATRTSSRKGCSSGRAASCRATATPWRRRRRGDARGRPGHRDRLAGNATRVTAGLDRRALTVLGAGHMCVDLCQGAVPALLPFLAAEHGYSYAALGALVLFSTIGSSIIQPLFGLLSDRDRDPVADARRPRAGGCAGSRWPARRRRTG